MSGKLKTEIRKSVCPCPYPGCPRNSICEKCQAWHRRAGPKTSCGK